MPMNPQPDGPTYPHVGKPSWDPRTEGRPVASALARILDREGEHVGFGLLVAAGKVVTCAHVIARALDKPDDLEQAPPDEITLDFPFIASGVTIGAQVAAWLPMTGDRGGDIAGLRLLRTTPAGAGPATLARIGPFNDHEILLYGYQDGRGTGVPTWVPGLVGETTPRARLPIDTSDRTGGLRVGAGFSGTPVWDRRIGQVIGLLTRTFTKSGAWHAEALSGGLIYQTWPELRTETDRNCPYRPLTPFGPADADLFFGRAELTEHATDLISDNAQTVVAGPSGVGKSSLVDAAVIPQLEQRGHVVLRINPTPPASLAMSIDATLYQQKNSPRISSIVDKSSRSRVHRLCDLLGSDRIVVVMDQFEQVLQEDPDQAQRLLAEMTEFTAVMHPHGRPLVRVALIVRDDHLARLLRLPAYSAEQPAIQRVKGLDREGLVQTAEGPLRGSRYARYETGLIDRIVDDTNARPYTLATLQAILAGLWHHQSSDGTLRHDTYDQLMHSGPPLPAYIERAWRDVPQERRTDALQLLLHLAVPLDDGSFARRRTDLAELTPTEQKAAAALADKHLVRLCGQRSTTTVEIAHDLLLQQWPTLADHLAEHQQFLRNRDDLRRRRAAWIRRGQDPAAFLRGSKLKQYVAWLQTDGARLSDEERAFILASQQFRGRFRTMFH